MNEVWKVLRLNTRRPAYVTLSEGAVRKLLFPGRGEWGPPGVKTTHRPRPPQGRGRELGGRPVEARGAFLDVVAEERVSIAFSPVDLIESRENFGIECQP